MREASSIFSTTVSKNMSLNLDMVSLMMSKGFSLAWQYLDATRAKPPDVHIKSANAIRFPDAETMHNIYILYKINQSPAHRQEGFTP